MRKLVAMFLSFAFLPAAAIADDVAKVVGTWKLVSFWNEFQDGSEGRPSTARTQRATSSLRRKGE